MIMQEKRDNTTFFRLVIMVLVTIVGIFGLYLGILAICDHFCIHLFDADNFEGVGWLSISYSTIFLSTSLLGILSDKCDTVYWVNINEYSLVNPRWINFYSLSTIGFVTLLIETYATIVQKPLLILISFIAGIITIISIFYKMIEGKYSRNLLKRKLVKQFQKKLSNESIDDKNVYIESIYIKVCRTTELACQDRKLDVISENIDFYFEYIHDDLPEDIKMEKLESFMVILSQCGFEEKVIVYLWDEDNEIKNKQAKQYAVAIICARNENIGKVWDKFKKEYFWTALDWKIDGIIEVAYKECVMLLEDERFPDELFTEKFSKYREIMCMIARILCIERRSEEDMTTFLIHRIGEKLSDYERNTLNMFWSEPVSQSNGDRGMYTEHMFSLCFFLEDIEINRAGIEVYLSALENIIFNESFINGQPDSQSGEYRFIVQNTMKKVLFETIKEYVSETKRDINIKNRCYELLDALVLQRFYDERDKKNICLSEIINLYNGKGMSEPRSRFLEKLYNFLDLWIYDYSDEIQSVYEDSLLQNSNIVWFIETAIQLLKDETEKKTFEKLKKRTG